MEQKTYVIRQIAFHYSDEYLYEGSEGAIAAEHSEYEAASKEYRDKEIAALRNAELYDIEPFSTCSSDDGNVREKLQQYFLDTFNIPLLKEQEGGYLDIDRQTCPTSSYSW